jgi:hypothetical protein
MVKALRLMEISVSGQAVALLGALLLGLAIGLLYDLLRPPRYRVSKWLGRFLDLCFALLAGAAMFFYAMAADDGRLGVWELSLTMLGFLLYMYALSPHILKILEVFYRAAGKIFRCAKENAKNIEKILKKLFSKTKECFRIKK